ncbi:hypothetical protein I4U23_028289 [Adineta vaga]|nr:hypothetical protein I4U23_028289 [Adineta vaga]
MTVISLSLFALYLILNIDCIPINVLISKPTIIASENRTTYRGEDPKLFGGGFQGDMLFYDNHNSMKGTRGVAVYGSNYRWPNNVIPYDISAITSIDDQNKITGAMQILMYAVGTPISGSTSRYACIYFRPRRSDDQIFVKIQYGNGCSAHVGYMNYYQSVMTLEQNGCFNPGNIQHELMHVIGFYHEQSRPDRDNYVQVNWENIEESMYIGFDKYAWSSSVYDQNTPYDYASIMHYEAYTFSKNGKPTMIPRQTGVILRTNNVLSPTDVFEKRAYTMVKLLVFAILLASSPASGLIESLFNTENTCYTSCHSNYAANAVHLEACKKGCDLKLLNEDCANQCKLYSKEEQVQASCQVGCTLSRPFNEVNVDKPILAIDPVPEVKGSQIIPFGSEGGRPRSIILIRLRNRPSLEMPSVPRLFNGDPIQMFNDMIRQFQEKTNVIEESIRKSFEQNAKDFPQPSEFGAISKLVKTIPIMPGNIRADSSSESSEESNSKRPLLNEFRHVIQHPREHQQYVRERMRPVSNRLQQFIGNVRDEWNNLVRKQPRIPIWIFLGILLSSSAILWYMVMSLCRHTPSRNLSIRAQELIYHPYEYDGYEKEKIQPDDHPYQVTESLPIKVKLSNI